MGAGFVALTGDLPGMMVYIKSFGPLLTIPLKGLIAFPIVYHYVAGVTFILTFCVDRDCCVVLRPPKSDATGTGVRHLLWDHGKIGDQAVKDSMLELEEVKKSSEFILYGSAGLSALFALYYYTV